jgi:hypothetical protein
MWRLDAPVRAGTTVLELLPGQSLHRLQQASQQWILLRLLAQMRLSRRADGVPQAGTVGVLLHQYPNRQTELRAMWRDLPRRELHW